MIKIGTGTRDGGTGEAGVPTTGPGGRWRLSPGTPGGGGRFRIG